MLLHTNEHISILILFIHISIYNYLSSCRLSMTNRIDKDWVSKFSASGINRSQLALIDFDCMTYKQASVYICHLLLYVIGIFALTSL